MENIDKIINSLPGKNCGACGAKDCKSFAEIVYKTPEKIKKCIHLKIKNNVENDKNTFKDENTWKDYLDRDYDFILDKFPEEQGPRETILLFNPANVEKLKLKKGDVIYGRPGWISCGCPVTHAGVIIEEPDYFNGTIVWAVTGPLMARDKGINIGYYNTTAYEGLVKIKRVELKIGLRYYFQPRFCMLQWRHCGLLNSISQTPDGARVRLEGLWIG